MLEMSVSGHLEVAHFMPDFPEGHPNRRMHGHSYFVKIILRSEEDSDLIVDLDVVKTKMDEILSVLDHSCVNDWDLPTPRPTMENMCRFLWKSFSKEFTQLYRIELERPTLGMIVSYEGKSQFR